MTDDQREDLRASMGEEALAGKPLVQGVVRGLLPLYILQLLGRGPSHGTGIAEAIAGMNGGVWAPSPGSLYPMLRQMEERGWIEGEWAPGQGAARKVYRLTGSGHAAVGEVQRETVAQLRVAKILVDIHLEALGLEEHE